MKLRIILLILALIIGAVAVYGVFVYISSMRASIEEEIEKVEVLVALQNIPRETTVETLIEQELVVPMGIPRMYLAEGVLTSLESYRGYVTANHINKGEQITTTKLAKPEELGLAFVIPDNMIAVSIPIDEVVGVSNLINVGDRVNVIATFFPEGEAAAASGEAVSGEEQPIEGGEESQAFTQETEGTQESQVILNKEITKTLLWNVKVLYIGTRRVTRTTSGEDSGVFGVQTRTESASTEISTVTLAVSPEDSEKLVFSEEMGSVWLALVPAEGIEKEDTPGSTLDNIFN